MRRLLLLYLVGFALFVLPAAFAAKNPEKREGKSPIEHFIVLMMENRSFDHLLYVKMNQNERRKDL